MSRIWILVGSDLIPAPPLQMILIPLSTQYRISSTLLSRSSIQSITKSGLPSNISTSLTLEKKSVRQSKSIYGLICLRYVSKTAAFETPTSFRKAKACLLRELTVTRSKSITLSLPTPDLASALTTWLILNRNTFQRLRNQRLSQNSILSCPNYCLQSTDSFWQATPASVLQVGLCPTSYFGSCDHFYFYSIS